MNARVLKHEKENHEVMNIIYEGRGGHEGDKELGKDPGVRSGKRFCVLLQSHDKPSRDFSKGVVMTGVALQSDCRID